ncbi:class I SAM-dependent methyltransferase [Nocardia otitidiscaviarum]|uniref:class I SAM-dependent methyltransferase n=1 Tax=Nocardia otitidiscaviarum TaxID=1823 RepID=UPI0004A6E34F|nr:class I SAM-dependent methyltransferase [Nocardia otitidiscaviarum]MBF6137036.1 class I SAM-dependent methyltransferase [Nocardia otitidiscaviarum]MBF6179958.1 class I SAM-dependent methyltransferase [Nocardia otitidiscaviarum]MBF6485236.1 class I SAM-dependent methyltransferase [Nocardia otitidiscaviarum]
MAQEVLRRVKSAVDGIARRHSCPPAGAADALRADVREFEHVDRETGHTVRQEGGLPAAPLDEAREARKRLFVDGDRDARQAWGRELMDMTERGKGAEADRRLERVLGVPSYRYHAASRDERPSAPFDGLPATLADRADVHGPEPSRLVYLTPVTKAMKLTADDVLYDIGSGIGKSSLFFGACTPAARVVGIEIEPAYARFADSRARDLGLSHVEFLNRDALEVDLSDGTAFYFYNPFSSTPDRDSVGMLADRLADLGSRQQIQIAVKGENMQTLLQDSGVFAVETVLEQPALWKVFRSLG